VRLVGVCVVLRVENCKTRSSIKVYSSPNKITMTKSIRMRWAGHVPCMKEEEFIQRSGGKVRKQVTTRKT
jgi:hypothetical protein